MNRTKMPDLKMVLLQLSVYYIAIGAVLLIMPNLSLLDICYAIGILLMICGIITVAIYFIRKKYLVSEHYGFSVGVTQFLLGLYAAVRSDDFSMILMQILAICMIFDSIVKMQNSIELFRFRTRNWWILLLLSLITAGLAFVILVVQFQDKSMQEIYTYSVLIFDGVVNIAVMVYLSRKRKAYQALTKQE